MKFKLKDGIFKNIGMLASGAIIARMISMISYPFITRLYSPGDFGILSIFTSLIALALPFATMRYSVAIPLPKHDGIAFNLFGLSALLSIALSSVFVIFILIYKSSNLTFLENTTLFDFWWLLIFGVLGAGLYEIMTGWATRRKVFKPVAKTSIQQSFFSSSIKILFGFFKLKPLGLLIGEVVNQGGGSFSLLRHFKNDLKDNFKYLSFNKMWFLLRYYKDFPLFRLVSQFLLVFSTKAPILYFAYAFDNETTGQLGLSFTVVAIPMSLFGTSTAKAYYSEIAEIGIRGKEEIVTLTKNVVKKLSILSALPILVLLLFSENLFGLFFGETWIQAGTFTSILAFYVFVQFITTPLMDIFNVFNKQIKFLEINIVRTLLICVAFSISFLFDFNVTHTLVTYTVLLCIHYIFTGYQVFKILK